MEETFRGRLFEAADADYQRFSASLLPGTERVIGVRLPALRKMAREIAKGDWRAYLKTAPGDYFEEVMLQGMIIGCAGCGAEETLCHVAAFVPKIENWSVCDSFCAGLKFAKDNKERVLLFLQPYFRSAREFEVRFAVVTLLNFFIDEEYIQRVLCLLDEIRHDGYYAKMAVAWALSLCYVRFPAQTTAYLKECALDDFTYHRTLRKITESRCVDGEAKAAVRRMMRG